MKKSVRIISGILGVIVLLPGVGKFMEPFKTLVNQQLVLSAIPFPDQMQFFVKFSQLTVGLVLIYLSFYGNELKLRMRETTFYLANMTVILMMLVASYVHLHPNVPAAVLPLGIKPPLIPIAYLILVFFNLYLYKSSPTKNSTHV
ncbi:hypothetical protein [Algoriphagus winogradskyi]|uniref:DUF4293 family protein n=1 Tax=Algoriphagus winogradskyi TaxID=237017 RepID=A0ABY1PE31_9BACT|nr:hypothetical protein [Algoriphagus winogradskyi]SMP32408.1 hypothetical protein SAMN06265367_10811 [Algoriphagus winogradskyi]